MMNLVAPLVGKPSNGWDIPPANFGAAGADYLTRGINAVLGLTANTTTEAIYYLGAAETDGQLLTGRSGTPSPSRDRFHMPRRSRPASGQSRCMTE